MEPVFSLQTIKLIIAFKVQILLNCLHVILGAEDPLWLAFKSVGEHHYLLKNNEITSLFHYVTICNCVREVIRYLGDQVTRWPGDQVTRWIGDQMTKWLIYVINWLGDYGTSWPGDQMTRSVGKHHYLLKSNEIM